MQNLSDSTRSDRWPDDPASSRPATVLIDGEQWLHVQHRYRLTPREREIAEMVCRGLRNDRIARRLNIRPGTVKTHLRNIYRKVHVQSKIGMLLQFVTEARRHSHPS